MDKFYEIMGDFYHTDMKKHKSPTKRLRQHREAAWAHKAHLKDNMHLPRDTYKLTYIASPHKSYVIQPKEGELNYDMAYKKPLKFYN